MRSALLAVMILGASATSWGMDAPDPRDSIILESKTVAPGLSGHPAFSLKVYITNKDTVAILTLALRESTITGTGYAVLDSMGNGGDPDGWALSDCVTFLKKTLNGNPAENFSDYDGKSPDRFLVAATFSPTSTNPFRQAEPTNVTRSAIWELKFMSTTKSPGVVQIDTTKLSVATLFTVIRNGGRDVRDVPVNFVKSLITIQPEPEKKKK